MRKKLFAILMSAMMMVTFMPAMAFATDTVDPYNVSTDHKTVTVTYDTTKTVDIKTVRVFNEGVVEVRADAADIDAKALTDGTVDWEEVRDILGYQKAETAKYSWTEVWYEIDTPKKDRNKDKDKDPGTLVRYSKDYKDQDKYEIQNKDKDVIVTNYVETPAVPASCKTLESYYDLAGATLVKNNGDAVLTTMKYAQFDANKPVAIKLVEQSYCAGYKAAAPKTAVVQDTEFEGWTVAIEADKEITKASFVDQTVTWTVDFSAKKDASKTYYYENNTVSLTQTIKAEDATTDSGALFFDKVDGTAVATSNEMTYDAAEHTVVAYLPDGIAVKFQKFDKQTTSYVDVEKVTYKDVAKQVDYRAIFSYTDATKKGKTTKPFSITVTKRGVSFASNETDKSIYEGETVDAYAYLKATVDSDTDSKIAKADAETLAALGKELYTATATKAAHEDSVTVSFKKNTFADEAAWKVVTDKYANYNLGTLEAFNNSTAPTAVKLTVVPSKANEIDFIGNASMTKTVHVKNAKAVKKAAVKNIKAEALSGTAITFQKISGNSKITVAADGKMTVKKGLKKGTYKVVVKAVAAAGNGFKRISTKATYTVKVVK